MPFLRRRLQDVTRVLVETLDEIMDDGNGALAIGELHQAIESFRRAVELDPGFQDGWIALAMTLYKLDRYKESIEAALEASRIDPNNQFVWSTLSLAYNANKQKVEAEAAGAKARIISWGGKIQISPASGASGERSE